MRFRSVTLHLRDPEDFPSYSDYLLKLSERLGSMSARVVSSEPSDDLDVELKAVHSGTGPSAFGRAWELLKDGYFTSISLGGNSTDLLRAADFIFRISEDLGPEYATMFALSSSDPPEGPYFPVTKAESFGMSFSLLYPSDLYGVLAEAEEPQAVLGYALSRIFSEAHSEVRRATSDLGEEVPFLGMDFSLSPWMEESSARVVSLLARSPFLGPGTPSAIAELNSRIDEASRGLRRLGFNELMLPMAEDDVLKEAALNLEMTARDLALLTPYCLAGLDMVVLPLSVSRTDLAKLIGDVVTSGRVKGRTVGVRVILVEAEPGEEVNLGRFGKVPVMML
ncbi:MAG: DUF711 family protein [Candidatus Korarchaeum sp.]